MSQLLPIFLNVLTPVFLLVFVGYLAGPKLKLEARTLSRFAYFILIPAFVFDVLSKAHIQAGLAVQVTVYAVAVHAVCAGLGWLCARLLRRPAPIVSAYVLISVFGNVGNFGLPMIKFRFPDQPSVLEVSTVYFLAILTISFVLGVAAATWHKGGRLHAALSVIKTPALIAVPPALIVNALGWSMPLALARPIELLAAAMIPTMIVALGVQLSGAGLPKINLDMLAASAIRLIGGPVIALLLAVPFGVTGIERSIGVIQAAMPTAVLASIIAFENDLIPEFVITAVLFSTLASIVTLTVVLAFV